MNSLPSSYDDTMGSALAGTRDRQCTVKDVARLARVSIATVSRVINDTGKVAGTTRTRVLIAVSTLQYRPNAHAAELGRAGGGVPRKPGVHTSAVALAGDTLISHPGIRDESAEPLAPLFPRIGALGRGRGQGARPG